MTEQVTPPAAPAEPEKKKGGIGKIIVSVVSILVVIGIIAVVKFGLSEVIAFVTGDTSKAAVGDCITDSPNAEDMKTVDCGKPEAAFKVVGIGEDTTQAEAEQVCSEFPDAETYLFMWEGTQTESTKGRVLCLETNQK